MIPVVDRHRPTLTFMIWLTDDDIIQTKNDAVVAPHRHKLRVNAAERRSFNDRG
jgi:hypothetical protein